MTTKRLKYQLLSHLRALGLTCHKTPKPPKGIRISRTLCPDGTTIEHLTPPKFIPENVNSIESEIHVFLEDKKLSNPKCEFDSNKKSCVCGKSLDDFLKNRTNDCHKKIKNK